MKRIYDEDRKAGRLAHPEEYPAEEFTRIYDLGEDPEFRAGSIGRPSMTEHMTYRPTQFNLSGLLGISDETLEMHFKLYEGYVKGVNDLNTRIADMLKNGTVDQEEFPAYSELTRRLGFEYNGMVLHEYYFENLKGRGDGAPSSSEADFTRAAEESFGSFDIWKADFAGVGKMRGVGWAICYQDPRSGRLSNHWITLHEIGNVAGYAPILVMDVWEHAYLLDYAPADRSRYIDAFFSNVDWEAVNNRLNVDLISPASAA
jgi:Fe-Mn family superoxide dismutase